MQNIKKGMRLTGDERERVAQSLTTQYQDGKSIRALAEETGRSYGFIHRMLRENDVDLRGRGGSTKRTAQL
ncbi:MAG: helix-turn-helix domain-containing protein [Actinomycetota bacterium]